MLSEKLEQLFKKYPELGCFADEKVNITFDGHDSKVEADTFFTPSLIKRNLISQSRNNGRYVELERTLGSISHFQSFLNGSEESYSKFVSVQKTHRLIFKNFKYISTILNSLITSMDPENEWLIEAFEAYLVYSDLGKTPEIRKRAKKLNIECPDHDDFFKALFSMEEQKNIAKVIPSFGNLHSKSQKWIIHVAKSVDIHLGHVLHLEGGHKMFEPLLKAIQSGIATEESIKFYYLIQIFDVSAAAGHINNKGSLVFDNNTYKSYDAVWQSMQELQKMNDTAKALDKYVEERSKDLEIKTTSPNGKLLLRIACMARLNGAEIGAAILRGSKKLEKDVLSLLNEVFGTNSGFNLWARNPSYIPAVLSNLKNHGSNSNEQIELLFRGAKFIASVCNLYEQKADTNSEDRLCFNPLAKLAASDHSQLYNFNVELITFDSNNKVLVEPGKPAIPAHFGIFGKIKKPPIHDTDPDQKTPGDCNSGSMQIK